MRTASGVIGVEAVRGGFGPANNYEDSKIIRERLFRKFGFVIDNNTASANFESLHECPVSDILEVSVEEVLVDWVKIQR